MRNKLVRRIALLLSVAVMSVSVVACGGGKGDAAQGEETTLTEEEYEAKQRNLARSLTAL